MKWSIQNVPIDLLKKFDKNCRLISKVQEDHLIESINKFGLCQPIVCNLDYTIIGGHQRFRSLVKLRYENVDVYIPDKMLSNYEISELCIRLNKNSGYFFYDDLANNYEIDDLINWGFELKDFDIISEEEKVDKPKSTYCKMNICFKTPEDLQSAENRISTIVDEYEGASYKIKLPK
jgi:hypothetical protein